jgi:N-acetylneuraminate synthase
MSVFIIAEAGVNHNGERDLAFDLVDAAAAAGADAVKFQTFNANELASTDAPKAAYQTKTTKTTETQLEMLRRLELPHTLHYDLIDHCSERQIAFLSAPFDTISLSFLVNDLNLQTIKIPSGEITNGPFLLAAGKTGRNIILSTGMSTLEEIETALGVLAFGFSTTDKVPSLDAFKDAFRSEPGRNALTEKVTLLHCTTEYPAPYEDANLNAMETMRNAFGLRVGFSDHTPGIAVPIAAAALGATIVEKHFTMDRSLPGPDHQASLEPNELRDMVEGIRAIESALGDGIKKLQRSEKENIKIARKSPVTLKPIKAGEPFTSKNIGNKRPYTGVSPMDYWGYLGKLAERDFTEGEKL